MRATITRLLKLFIFSLVFCPMVEAAWYRSVSNPGTGVADYVGVIASDDIAIPAASGDVLKVVGNKWTAGPVATGSGSGDMTKAVYDIADNGKVDNADDVTCTGCVADGELASTFLKSVTADAPLSGSGTAGSHLVLSTAGTWSGNAGTASALAANGANCSAGSAAGGVTAAGVAEDCTAYLTALPALNSANIWVGNGSNVATAVTMSGDASLANTGAIAVNKTRLNVRNETGSQIASTKAVYVSGYNNLPLITLANNTAEIAHNVVGITVASINDQANGYIAVSGQCDAETNTWDVGTELYLSTAGALTSTTPTSGSVRHVAIVTVKANYPTGKLLIYSYPEENYFAGGANVDTIIRMGDTEGTYKTSFRDYTNNEVASINSDGALVAVSVAKSGGTSSQFLKADGSVDSSSYSIACTSSIKATDYTLTTSDCVVVGNTSGGEVKLTLPTAVGNTNVFHIKRSGANTLTVDTTSSQTIDGDLTAVLTVDNVNIDIHSDGSNWRIL